MTEAFVMNETLKLVQKKKPILFRLEDNLPYMSCLRAVILDLGEVILLVILYLFLSHSSLGN